jgi:uncharacterized membrane protein HdeD (DUF308 family)
MLAITIFVFPALGVATLIVLLAVGLIFAGVRSVSIAGYGRFSKGMRALGAITGVLAIVLAVTVMIFPGLALFSLVTLLCFGLMAYGVGRLSLAYSLKATSTGLRGVIVAVGILDVILSVVVVLLPGVALLSLVVILGLALFLTGIEMCVSGAVGRTWLGDAAKAAENL